jgi:hypothetical protein
MGNFQDVLYTDNYVAIRYDAQGYYGIISYTIVSRDKFELIVGGGIGKLNQNLEFDFSRYHYGGSTEYIIQYNSSDLTSILFTELHYYITNNFSLLFTMDYCNSQEITVRGDDNFRIPERKISFGNGSFGFGVGFHF